MHTPEQERVDEVPDLDPSDAYVVKQFGGLPKEQGGYDREEEFAFLVDEEEDTSIELNEEEFLHSDEEETDAENS